MQQKYITIILILICLGIFKSGICQRVHEPSIYLNVNTGLSNNTVNAIFEDSRGYLWIGTSIGLNRYDGYEIKVYKNRLGAEIICSNRIDCINEDSKGRLWLGTDHGVAIYDFDMDSFVNLQSGSTTNRIIENTSIVAIEPSSDGLRMLCATQSHGLLIYDMDGHLVKNVNNDWVDIVGFKSIADNQYLIATKESLSIYDLESGKITDIKDVISKGTNLIRDIKITSNHIFILFNRGIKKLNYTIDTSNRVIDVKYSQQLYYSESKFKNILIDQHGKLFLSDINSGLYMLPSEEQFGDKLTVVSNSIQVYSFAEIKSRNYICIGSMFKGVYLLNNSDDIFHELIFSKSPDFRLSYIIPYNDSLVIVKGTNNGAVLYNIKNRSREHSKAIDILPSSAFPFVYNDNKLYALDCTNSYGRLLTFANGKWKEITVLRGEGLPHLILCSVWVDKSGYIWFSSRERLSRLQVQERLSRLKIHDNNGTIGYTLQQIELPITSNELQKIRDIAFDSINHRAWIGSATQGVYYIDNADSNTIISSQITHLYSDNKDCDYNNLKAVPSNFVSSMAVVNEDVYLGNFMGLFKGYVKDGKASFKVYTKKSGLASDAVKSIVADREQNLFISTVRGISLFDTENEKFRNYDLEDGLPFYSFGGDHSVRVGDNSIILCSNNNAVKFNPQLINMPRQIPNIEFGELRLFNKIVRPRESIDGKIAIRRCLTDGDTIRLSYKNNMLSVDVNSLHFGNPQHYLIRYRFGKTKRDGVENKEWINLSSNNKTISFSELKYGNYCLEISAANSIGQWGKTKAITVIITPPFWLTWWAYLVYFFVLSVMSYAIVKFILHLQSLRHTIEIENINKHEAREKQLYISNIAHEIKTPLAMVVSAADSLYEQYNYDAAISQKLQLVQRQSHAISKMVDTVQSIYLNDMGFLHLNLTIFEFTKFIQPIADDFSFMANNNQKHLTSNSSNEKIYVKADISMLEKVLHNLLSNANKYTHKGGRISIEWMTNDDSLIITVKDDGIGIAPEEIEHIFERYYRSDTVRNQNIIKGNGIGLDFSRQLIEMHGGEISVKSQLSEGSLFIVRLPIVVQGDESVEEENEKAIIVEGIEQQIPEISEFKDSLIFIVEDNNELRNIMLDFVGRHYEVKGYADGEAALKAMDELCPDLILSDVSMPNIDGYELCQRVKSNLVSSHIPIILITACVSVEEKLRCREVGADIYISKPFYPKYVIACIETTLRNRRALRESFKIGVRIEGANNVESNKDNEFLDKLYCFLDEELSNESIDINVIARKMYLNRTYFYQKVKTITNMTPFEFIKEYRLVKAAEMLSNSEKSIADICVDVGFKNRAHFSKIFKERFGESPSKYKRTI